MSHEIENINGNDCIAYAGQTPWHGLGVKVDENLTPAEIMKAAGLDWKVVPRQLYFDVDGRRHKVANKALVRDVDNKPLTVVTGAWNPVQNAEAFEFFDSLVKAGNMKMHTAGSLLGGKRVWALAKIEEAFDLRINGKVTQDKVEGFLLLTNPHEYGKAIDARFTAIRVVCNNTHTLAMEQGKKKFHAVSLNHRQKFDGDKLQRLLGVAHLSMDRYKEHAEYLASRRYTDESLKEFMSAVFPHCNDNKADELSRAAKQAIELIDTQPGADFAPGTFWNAYNATTFMMDHVVGRGADTRLTSAWYGYNRARKQTSLDTALAMAKAA